ncbi:hypothetical protein ENBRE01_0475 [Enteropsectra breve]|nr:hypothetical protein ENBRE01_0475 [Enteropsectra breve]
MDYKETGATCVAIGMITLFFGACILMDKALLIVGNIICVFGFSLLMQGLVRRLGILRIIPGVLGFVLGMLLILSNQFILGIMLEAAGIGHILYLLFSTIKLSITSYIIKMVGRKCKLN